MECSLVDHSVATDGGRNICGRKSHLIMAIDPLHKDIGNVYIIQSD